VASTEESMAGHPAVPAGAVLPAAVVAAEPGVVAAVVPASVPGTAVEPLELVVGPATVLVGAVVDAVVALLSEPQAAASSMSVDSSASAPRPRWCTVLMDSPRSSRSAPRPVQRSVTFVY
jgi:hypothetical protein